MLRKSCGCTEATCGCCVGTQKLTPLGTVNRAGLDALRYRVGTHGAFLESMKARLASMSVDAPGADGQMIEHFLPLLGLTTRDAGDAAIALLDSWATVGDVLTFYQERIANESYLRCATERRSVLELARLVGYALRPGVASTVYLAYTLDDKQIDPVDIPVGARTQSIPGPGELPQSFETDEKVVARREWNNLPVRQHKPQNITWENIDSLEELYVVGTETNLKVGDTLLFVFGDSNNEKYKPRIVAQVEGQFDNNRTRLRLMQKSPISSPSTPVTSPDKFVNSLLREPIVQVRNSLQLNRSLSRSASKGSDVQPQLLVNFAPRLKDTYYSAWSNANVNDAAPALQSVYAMRVATSLFGASVAKLPTYFTGTFTTETKLDKAFEIKPQKDWEDWPLDSDEASNGLYLDRVYEAILPGGYVMIPTKTAIGTTPHVLKLIDVQTTSRSAYGISGKTTQLTFNEDWWLPKDGDSMATLRKAFVYAQSEALTLVEEPLPPKVREQDIELAGLYKELTSGRWVILSGERADIPGVTGVKVSELQMIAGLKHDYDPQLPGDKIHTTLSLATPLAYKYKRDTLMIYGNIVKATNGETHKETLGNGDGSQAMQSFVLKQPPLTYVPAHTPAGVESTLQVYVNNVEWHETDTLAGLGPNDRRFVTKTDDNTNTTVIFGNGKEGVRLPTGRENVKAVYRNGIGRGGNVLSGQISILMTRPLGVKAVINPLRASGGADRENRDQARENVPLAVMALDRLVSVSDYADFTRTFAGIGKALARRLSDGKRELLHITIAGADDIPIDPASDLYRNLLLALRQYGDPDLAIRVDLRELKVLSLSAKVRLQSDYLWEPVAETIRSTLLDVFGFQRRALGQPVLLSEVISVIQNIDGVAYVDVDAFGGIPEKTLDDTVTPPVRRLLTLDELALTMKTIINPSYPSLLLSVPDLIDGAVPLITDLLSRRATDADKKTNQKIFALSKYLQSRFSTETKQLLQEYHLEHSVLESLRQVLVKDLNYIIQGASIYDQNLFESIVLVPETQVLLQQAPQGDELVQLNRWLLEDAYPDGIVKSSRQMLVASPPGPAQSVEVNLADFDKGILRPAQLAIFSAAVPDTLILNQIT